MIFIFLYNSSLRVECLGGLRKEQVIGSCKKERGRFYVPPPDSQARKDKLGRSRYQDYLSGYSGLGARIGQIGA